MSRKKKPMELKTHEAVRRLFPKTVIRDVKKAALRKGK